MACLFKVRNVYVNERHNFCVQRWMRADDVARGVPVRARVAIAIASRRRSPAPCCVFLLKGKFEHLIRTRRLPVVRVCFFPSTR